MESTQSSISKMNSSNVCKAYVLSPSQNTDSSIWDFNCDIIVCALNGLLIPPTIILNILVALAVGQNPALRRKPSYILVCLLAVSNLGVGAVVQPLYIARKIAALRSNHCAFCETIQAGDIMSHLFCVPPLLFVTATNVDRWLAVTTGLRYRHLVTITRVFQLGASSLLFAGVILSLRILLVEAKYMGLAAVLMFTSLVIIFTTHLHSRTQLQKRQRQIHCIDMSIFINTASKVIETYKNKKALVTLALVTLVTFVCYAPFVVVVLSIALHGRSRELNMAREVTVTLLYSNACLTPFLLIRRSLELKLSVAQIFSCLQTVREVSVQSTSSGREMARVEAAKVVDLPED